LSTEIENKGTAFSKAERASLRLRGLLPPAVEDLDTQAHRALEQFNSLSSPIAQYNYLSRVKNESSALFYFLLINNLELMCPIVYTPTVGLACQQFCHEYRTSEGMYFCKDDMGHMRDMLDNWPHDVSIIVVTDGSRILGLGDLGTNGMGIPVGKLALYTACGGFDPKSTLPVMMDTGTNNKSYLKDPLYLGSKHERLANQEYYAMWDEFLLAVKDKWPNAILQFEDISNDHCFELLQMYRHKLRAFNDDIQGTGAVIAAGFLSACRLVNRPLKEHKVVFLGAGSAAVGVANQMCTLMATSMGCDPDDVRQQFYLVDSQGLVTSTRGDVLQDHKLPYARGDMEKEFKKLEDLVNYLKPTAIIGLSGIGGMITEELISKMGEYNERPIIFALSNPTSKAECTAESVYTITNGRGIYASGSPFQPVTLPDGRTLHPGQGNNMYIFPGLGFGAYLARASTISDGMVTAAAASLANQVTDADLETGRVYPPIDVIRQISVNISTAVMEQAYAEGLAQLKRPENIHAYVESKLYWPKYRNYG